MTPKELQGLKWKMCTSCGENVDTNYLIQPNEKKRRSNSQSTTLLRPCLFLLDEELLKKIRERKARLASERTDKSSCIANEEAEQHAI